VVIGAPGRDYINGLASSDEGHAYVLFGGPGVDATPDLDLVDRVFQEGFGSSVSMAGDTDGDGYTDLIVGAVENDAAGDNAGRVYVVTPFLYQVASPDGGEVWVEGQPASVRWFGREVADLGLSVDGGFTWQTLARGVGGTDDNTLSMIVPAIPTDYALVRLVDSGQSADSFNSDVSAAPFRIIAPPGEPPAAAVQERLAFTLGTGVSTCSGDFDGDGHLDILAGDPYDDVAGTNAGRVFIYLGGPDADSGFDLELAGQAAGDRFGWSIANVGDVNTDGYEDFLVGAPYAAGGGIDRGRAYVFFGGPGADTSPDVTLTGPDDNDLLGWAVSAAGDFNGDGVPDVLVGAPDPTPFALSYIFFGGTFMNTVADVSLEGQSSAGSGFGKTVAAAGDVNGDGFHDVLVGEPEAWVWLNGGGRAHVYFGGPSPDGSPDVSFVGAVPSDGFGAALAGAGDLDGDGYDDVIVGAAFDGSGRAVVFRGGASPDATADAVFQTSHNDEFGAAVAGIGDVNGDGFADFTVGAPSDFRITGDDLGRVHVYYGGFGWDSAADLEIVNRDGANLYMGQFLAPAGDFDGDGFDDLLVMGDGGKIWLFDFDRFHILAPTAGQTWDVGATETISWLGTEPADLWLSVDGGASYDLLRSSVGGGATNTISQLVPHRPSRFSRLRLTPVDPAVGGFGESDSLFTVQAAISLLALRTTPGSGAEGTWISWETEPGPEKLAGYRLEKAVGGAAAAGGNWRTIVARTKETAHLDPDATPGTRYRLSAVNGLGEETVLGETALELRAALAAWPLPYRGGDLRVSFATLGGLGGGAGPADVTLYDVIGRRVRTVSRGSYEAGFQETVWDGRDDGGRLVSAGVYFLRVATAGNTRTLKLTVLR